MTQSRGTQLMVSDHVIVRWLERVEGHDLDEVRNEITARGRKPTDIAILQELHRLYGITRGHVGYKIATREVRVAIKAGAKRINRGDWTLQIHDGVIVTILPRKGKFISDERARRLGKTKRKEPRERQDAR